MKSLRNALVAVGLLLCGSVAFGQSTTTQTTLATAITTTYGRAIVVTSATGILAPSLSSASQPSTQIFIDGEMLDVTAVNGTTVSVRRGANGTRAVTHASGAIVYAGPAGGTGSSPFYDLAKLGSCTAANEPFLPAIDYYDNIIFDCSGGLWTAEVTGTLNAPVAQTLTTDYTNATTTFSTVSPFSFTVHAGRTYTYRCKIIWQGSASTTGPKYQFTGPASPTKVAASAFSAVTASTVTQATAVAFSSAMANAGTVTTATNFVDDVQLAVINGANAGTVALQAAANGTGTLTIKAGSSCVQD